MTSRRRPAEYKQMALETAIRNPERYFSVLKTLLQFDGLTLNDRNLLAILTEFYRHGIVKSGDVELTVGDVELEKQIIQVNKSRNADGGFPRGFPARFWTYMRTPSELGLVYARYNRPLKISPLVKQVLDGVLDEQEVFALQVFRGNRRSPYRNVKNNFNFFKFIYQVLKQREEHGHHLSFEQFILTMFSHNGEVESCIREIEANKFTSPQSVFLYLKDTYRVTTKLQTVTRDYPDVVIRMLVITGMISIKSSGAKFLIGLNKNKISFFDKLLEIAPSLNNKAIEDTNGDIFYEQMNTPIPAYEELLSTAREVDVIEGHQYTAQLLTLIDRYSLNKETIKSELTELIHGRPHLFKEMSDPLKLEFYIALLVALNYGDKFEIRPNYKADDEGKPYSHAPGGGGDIDIYSERLYWLIEVTLIQNRQQQVNNETTTIFRHVKNPEFENRSEKYLSFIAPYIHEDTQDYFEYATVRNHPRIQFGSYKILDFIQVTNDRHNIDDMKHQTQEIIDRQRSALEAKS